MKYIKDLNFGLVRLIRQEVNPQVRIQCLGQQPRREGEVEVLYFTGS